MKWFVKKSNESEVHYHVADISELATESDRESAAKIAAAQQHIELQRLREKEQRAKVEQKGREAYELLPKFNTAKGCRKCSSVNIGRTYKEDFVLAREILRDDPEGYRWGLSARGVCHESCTEVLIVWCNDCGYSMGPEHVQNSSPEPTVRCQRMLTW